MAKVLLINGSPKNNGCTVTALTEMIKVFQSEDIETELVHIGSKDIRGCIACGHCKESGNEWVGRNATVQRQPGF